MISDVNKKRAQAPVWRDAREDLPPEQMVVLVSVTPFFTIGYVNERGGWHTQGGGELLGVDYWMPIPPTPEVKP